MDHDNNPSTPDNTPPQPLDANPYPPPPPIFSEASTAAEPQPAPGAPPPPPAGGTYQTPPPPNPGAPTKEERNWAMFAHLSLLVSSIVVSLASAGLLAFLGFLGPLVIYLMKKDDSAFIADHAKEALNFGISLAITFGAIIALIFLLFWTIILPILLWIVALGIGIVAMILLIIATIKASEGVWYRYPFTLRLIK